LRRIPHKLRSRDGPSRGARKPKNAKNSRSHPERGYTLKKCEAVQMHERLDGRKTEPSKGLAENDG